MLAGGFLLGPHGRFLAALREGEEILPHRGGRDDFVVGPTQAEQIQDVALNRGPVQALIHEVRQFGHLTAEALDIPFLLEALLLNVQVGGDDGRDQANRTTAIGVELDVVGALQIHEPGQLGNRARQNADHAVLVVAAELLGHDLNPGPQSSIP